MALYQSKQVVARTPISSLGGANHVMPIHAEFVVPAGGLAINDVVEMYGLAPNHRVVDAIVHNTAAGAGATFDMGYLSRAYGVTGGVARTCGNEFIAGGDMNATTVKRLTKSVTVDSDGSTENPTDALIGWGFKVTGAAWAAGTVVRATLFVVPRQ